MALHKIIEFFLHMSKYFVNIVTKIEILKISLFKVFHRDFSYLRIKKNGKT